MKRILGGKENACESCGGTMIYLYVKHIGTVSQCRECGSMTNGRAKDEIYIYSEER